MAPDSLIKQFKDAENSEELLKVLRKICSITYKNKIYCKTKVDLNSIQKTLGAINKIIED